MSSNQCKSCGAELLGDYCHVCGEKRLSEKDRSLRHWFKETFVSLIQLDSKLLRTLKFLFLNPKRLAQDYFRGRRVPYMKMINLFLIANLIYFLTPGVESFKTTLRTQMNGIYYGPLVEAIVTNYRPDYEKDPVRFEETYNRKTSEVSKLVIILAPILLGLIMYALYFRRLFLTDAFNLALQYWATFLFFFTIPIPIFGYVMSYIRKEFLPTGQLLEDIFTISALVISAIYFWSILKPLSKRVVPHIVKVIAITFSLLLVLTVYRILLFGITMVLI